MGELPGCYRTTSDSDLRVSLAQMHCPKYSVSAIGRGPPKEPVYLEISLSNRELLVSVQIPETD